jgi:hypothetical protein
MNFKSFFTFALTFTLFFISCNNEPLDGEFIVDDPSLLDPSFRANLEGVTFVGETASAQTVQGITTITGIRSNNDIIVITISGTATGTYSLTTQGFATFGIDVEPLAFSTANQGGLGQVVITEYSNELEKISGTFAFTATRPLLDDNGNPVLDGSGNPTFDTIVINQGEFTNIPLDSDGSVGGGDIDMSEFYADVDDVPFSAEGQNVNAIYIESNNVMTLEAVNNNRTIRIKIVNPEEGEFDLAAISNQSSRATYSVVGEDPYTTEVIQGGSGTLTITAIDFFTNRISGTFEFVAGREDGTETVNVTNGSFTNINIITGLPDDGSDLMVAFIDGLDFVADEIVVIPSEEFITVQGTNSSTNEMIIITFPTDTEPDVYNFTFEGEYNATYFDGTNSFSSQNGIFVLIQYNVERIRFYFNFNAVTEFGGDIEHVVSQGLLHFNL